MKIIIVFITGIGIFAALKIIRFLINKINRNNTNRKKLNQVFPLFEILVWTVFIFWITRFNFQDKIYYPYIIAGLIIIGMSLMAWFFFRDVFAGAIFKIQNDLSIGDYIKIGSVSGQIKAMKLTFIEVIPDTGQTIKIPNSKLNHELISALTTPEGMEEFNIQLIIDKQYSKQEIEEKIKFIVTTSPWCNYKNQPVIKLQHEGG